MDDGAALERLKATGPEALALALLLGGIGVPVPATMLLLAAGAFVRQGDFDWHLAFGLALLGAVCGDAASYLMGRYGVHRMLGRLEHSVSWHRAAQTFEQRGASAIVLTRFLFTPLALPTNLMAGDDRYPFVRFVGLCAFGEVLWVLLYGGLGYVFAESWEAVRDQAGSVAGWIIAGLVVAIGIYELAIHWHGHLRIHPRHLHLYHRAHSE